MKRLNEQPPLTDSQLDEIIDAPRIELRINKDELLEYFETINGQFEPSWMFMDRSRMKEIFQFCLRFTALCRWGFKAQMFNPPLMFN